MIEMAHADRMDFVSICRANPGKTSRECFDMWREWLTETHGALCVDIDGRLYPPGTYKSKPFRGSILYKGETAAERRAIMAGGYIPPDVKELTGAQDFIDAKLKAIHITQEQWKEKVKNHRGKT